MRACVCAGINDPLTDPHIVGDLASDEADDNKYKGESRIHINRVHQQRMVVCFVARNYAFVRCVQTYSHTHARARIDALDAINSERLHDYSTLDKRNFFVVLVCHAHWRRVEPCAHFSRVQRCVICVMAF